jgi:hypothetical protein
VKSLESGLVYESMESVFRVVHRSIGLGIAGTSVY